MSFLDDLGSVASFAFPASIGASLFAKNALLGGSDSLPGLGTPPTPPPPPDLTDEAVRQAALAQRRRLLAGQGLGSMFLSGPLGDMSAVSTSTPSAGGI